MKAYKAPELQIFAVEAIDVLLASSGLINKGEGKDDTQDFTNFGTGKINIFA